MKILVISDIHGNSEALAAILRKEHDADRTVFLGDSVLSGPQSNETMALLQGIDNGTFIMGNHDLEMLKPEKFANYPARWRALNNWIIDHFDPVGYEFLRNLQSNDEYEVGGIRMYLHHGTVDGGPRHALPNSPDSHLLKLAEDCDSPYVLFGHSHVQFTRVINGQVFINPGSVGQNRCGSQLACYGLFEDGEFQHCQVTYDQTSWLEALDRIRTLDEFPDFREWLKDGLIRGYGVGEREPWTQFAAQGYC